ncbi:replication protein [Candidatus Wolfebacteria bacterium]|nr:replication protein [Candidatus Wolfebacteria bacterium]
MEKIIPNTTQVPNVVLDEWLPNLKDVELRVLLIIIRQTLGWIEDKETGRRKERDWISRWQLMKKTGRGHSSVSAAIEKLSRNGIIESYDAGGKLLATAKERSGNKVFYRLNLNTSQLNLFSRRNAPVQNVDRLKRPVQNLVVQNSDATKETSFTKDIAKASELDSNKKKLPTNSLMGAFSHYSKTIRGVKPKFERFKDGNLIKCTLKHLTESQVEMLFLWFLKEKTNMRPAIGAALCKEVIADFIDTSHREYGFYARLDDLWRRYSRSRDRPQNATTESNAKQMVEQLSELKKRLASKFAVQTAHEERAM